ncbi:hypothetical protein HYY69_08145 [Candidatus Woesearchaeota archaeon]|nr:hypothetical protein [Candidatus Woesearchaeota archaeon]
MYRRENMIFKLLKQCFESKKSIIYLSIISLVVLLLPMILRFMLFHQHIVPGIDAYDDLNVVKKFSQEQRVNSDGAYNPYHYLLSVLSKKIPLEILALILPVILGIISMVLWYLILEQTELKTTTKLMSCLLLLFSPIYIYVFTISSFLSLLVFLTLLAFFLITNKNKCMHYSSIIFLLAIGTLSLFTPVLIISLYLYLTYVRKQKARYHNIFLLIFWVIIAAFIYLASFFVFKTPAITTYHLENMNLLQNNISDLGAVMGFGVFTLLLLGIGLYYMIKERRNIFLWFIILSFLTLISWYYNKYRSLLNFIVILWGAYGYSRLWYRKWDIPLLKKTCLFMLLLGVVFSGLSFVNRLVALQPTQGAVEQLQLIQENLQNLPEGKILSHEENGFFINYYLGEDRAFLDKKMKNQYADEIANKIFYSRNIEESERLLQEHNIRYFFITDKMKAGQIWKKDTDGLLFLLEKSEKFKRVGKTQDIEVWEVLY